MTTAKEILGQALDLPVQERTALANALLDSLDGPSPYQDMTPEEFRAEMIRRAEEALATPGDGDDWDTARERILSERR